MSLKFKSLNTKLILLVFAGIIPIVLGLFIYIFPVFEKSIINERKEQVEAVVDMTINMLANYQEEVKSKKLTLNEAQDKARALFAKLRYNNTDYMFAYDKNGICMAHGTTQSMVGKDRSQSKDPNGKMYVQDFMKVVNNSEGAFVDYKFSKEKDGPAFDKVSYVKYYTDWGWIVGSGVYLDVIQDKIAAIKLKVYIGIALTSLLAFSFSWFYARSLTNKLNHTASELNSEADLVSDIAENISKASVQLSSSTTQQAAALQETSASVEETSAMIEKNAENAKKSIHISNQSQNNVEEGKKIVSELIQSMNEISISNQNIMKQIDESNRDIANIVKIINEIGEKTKVINDIVFQTKLLSFNASVEAARAGEHGKGFAVVAEEVGKLAEMSGSSSKEISQLLSESISNVESTIQKSKSRIDQIIATGELKVTQGGNIAKQCGELFDIIVNNVNQVNSMISEISEASNEQANGIKEINTAVIELDSVGQQNSTMSQQTQEYAEKLRGQVIALRKMTEELNKTITG